MSMLLLVCGRKGREDVTITYRDDVTLTTRSCVLGTCSVINVSYSRSITRGIFRRSHLQAKKGRSAKCVHFMMYHQIFSTDMERHMRGSQTGESWEFNVDNQCSSASWSLFYPRHGFNTRLVMTALCSAKGRSRNRQLSFSYYSSTTLNDQCWASRFNLWMI